MVTPLVAHPARQRFGVSSCAVGITVTPAAPGEGMTNERTPRAPSVNSSPRRLRALDHALDAIKALRPCMPTLRKRDAHLADQLHRALNNVCLNLGEGTYRTGGNRQLSYRRAAGEANEALVALEVAVAWGTLRTEQVAQGADRLEHVLAILMKLR